MADVLHAERVFTFTSEPWLATDIFGSHPVTAVAPSQVSALARSHWQWLLPLMPYAWKRVDFRGYDVVITSSHSCVNAIRTKEGQIHISYCHTPMRYAWEWRSEIRRIPTLLRPLWPAVAAVLRKADRGWARNVTRFIANSQNVSDRIRRYYDRDSDVLHPPIDTDFWTPGGEKSDFFLFAGRLVPYKRADIAVAAARSSGRRLVVAGTGPELQRLRGAAGPSTTFIENPSKERLRELYRSATALVFPGIEDFGMTLVESQACGTPVIALAEGGALEAVKAGSTGVLYKGAGARGLIDAMNAFSSSDYDSATLRAHAETFNAARFDARLRKIVADTVRAS